LNNLPGDINTDYRHIAKPWPLGDTLEQTLYPNSSIMVLYKYFPPTTNSFKSLINAGIWCDNYTNMNDPFECLAIVPRQFEKGRIEEFKTKALKSGIPQYQLLGTFKDEAIITFMNSFRQEFIKNSYFFGSLSESCDNILLWSHYAASHTGFVLAIDFDENNNHVQKVTYQDSLPDFDIDWYFKIKNEEVKDSENISYLLKDFAIKSTNWAYEKEWRVARKDKGYFRFKPEQVKALYYGLNCNVDIEKVVVMLLSYTDDDMPILQDGFIDKPFRDGG
jgi:hypothetical protein